ncbi:single-stranded DNA-binding protein, mitochondrial-like, partial [Phalaenopsis equestris]
MAFASIYRNLFRRSIIPRPLFPPARLFNTPLAGSESDQEVDDPFDASTAGLSGEPTTQQRRTPQFRPLENGLDPGVYKAILVGKVGQKPVQKQLKSSRVVVLFSVATGGIRNNRRPLEDEEPMQYAERCAVQWHRVCIYPERLGRIALNHVKPG